MPDWVQELAPRWVPFSLMKRMTTGQDFMLYYSQISFACQAPLKHASTTWRMSREHGWQKNGWKRIDYIALPHQLLAGHIQTWTHVIEKDVLKEDHRAASLTLTATLTTRSDKRTHCHPSITVDRAAMQTVEGKQTCAQLLEYFCDQQPPWTASADAHANFLNEAATQCLPKHFPVHRRQPKPSWIQEDTWDTIATTRKLRRQLRNLRQTWSCGIVRQIFQAWASGTTTTHSFRLWLKMLDNSTALALHQLSETRLTRIMALRRDEAAYIDNCARMQHDELTEAKGAHLWRKLRRDLPSFRKKTKKHLPFSVAKWKACIYILRRLKTPDFAPWKRCVKTLNAKANVLSSMRWREMWRHIISQQFLNWKQQFVHLHVAKQVLGVFPWNSWRPTHRKQRSCLCQWWLCSSASNNNPYRGKVVPIFRYTKGRAARVMQRVSGRYWSAMWSPSCITRLSDKGWWKQSNQSFFHFRSVECLRWQSVMQRISFWVSGNRQSTSGDLQPSSSSTSNRPFTEHRGQQLYVISLGMAKINWTKMSQSAHLGKRPPWIRLKFHINLQATIQELFSGTWNSVKVPCSHQQPVMQSTRGTRPGDPVPLHVWCRQSLLSFFKKHNRSFRPFLALMETLVFPLLLGWMTLLFLWKLTRRTRSPSSSSRSSIWCSRNVGRMAWISILRQAKLKPFFAYMERTRHRYAKPSSKRSSSMLTVPRKKRSPCPQHRTILHLGIKHHSHVMLWHWNLPSVWQGHVKPWGSVGRRFWWIKPLLRLQDGIWPDYFGAVASSVCMWALATTYQQADFFPPSLFHEDWQDHSG